MVKANPQGKGLVPILENLVSVRSQLQIPPKTVEQITCELFTSLFVLNSNFGFRPVINRRYWLYRNQDQFKLSLIAPDEWRHDGFGEFIGMCKLQTDLTWTLELSTQAQQDATFVAFLNDEQEKFRQRVASPTDLRDALPFYLAERPFFQRVLAAGLAYSLNISLNPHRLKHDATAVQGIDHRSTPAAPHSK